MKPGKQERWNAQRQSDGRSDHGWDKPIHLPGFLVS